MRHNKKGRKLGTDWSHTKAMKRSLVKALFLNDRIKTVAHNTTGDTPDVTYTFNYDNDKELVREIFEKVEQGLFADRQGGYTRIMKLGFRKGDNAPMVIMELCTEPVSKKTKTEEKPAAKKVAPKKVEAAEEAKAEEAKAEEVAEEAAPVEEATAEEAAPAEEAATEEKAE